MTVPFNTTGSVKALHLDTEGVAPRDVIPKALILNTSTQAGSVSGDQPRVRVPFVSLEDAPEFVAEAAQIDQSEPESTEVTIETGKVAVLVSISREQYGSGQAATLLSEAVRTAMIRKANRLYLSQIAPTPPNYTPPAGLTAQGLTDGGVLGDDLDEFVDAVATIETAGGTADFVLAHPAAWGAVSKLKATSDSNQSLVGAGVDPAQRQLLGVPVWVDRDVPADSIIVGDKAAILSAVGRIEVASSEDFLFDRDSIAVRSTFRFGAKVADVARIVQIGVGGS